MKYDILGIIGVEVVLTIISVAGIGCFLLERYNYFAFTCGVSCAVAFILFNIFVIWFLISCKKENKNE